MELLRQAVSSRVSWSTSNDEIEIVGIKDTTDRLFVRVLRCSASFWTVERRAIMLVVLLRGTKREEIERGQVSGVSQGSITPHTKFTAEAYILSKDEGGRHTPFFTNYRPQFYFRTTDVTGEVMHCLSVH